MVHFGIYTRDRLAGSQPFAGRELIRQGQIFAAAVQCRQRAVIGSRGLTAYHQNARVLDLNGKIYKQFAPRAEIILQVGTGATHLAFPAIRVSSGTVQLPQILCGIAVEFVLLQQTVHPAEQLFVGAFSAGVLVRSLPEQGVHALARNSWVPNCCCSQRLNCRFHRVRVSATAAVLGSST